MTVSAEATAEHFVPLHMYAVASICILYTHFRAQLFRNEQGKDFFAALSMITINGVLRLKGRAVRSHLANGFRIIRSLSSPPLPLSVLLPLSLFVPSSRQSCLSSQCFASWLVSTICVTTGLHATSRARSSSTVHAIGC